jgi:PAS domain S-box-containing protein
MNERKRVFLLILIMATASLIVAGIAIFMLYRAAFDEERARLVETAQSQARLIEAVARFDSIYSSDYPEGPEEATLSQIVDAHKHYKGFGETGEFTLAKREGDSIVFLLSHRHYDLQYPKPVPFNSELAEAMRRALLGLSGTVVGLDYRGEVVLAAHEPVAELNCGIVAKIDLAEIRRPFVKAGVTAGSIAVLIVLAGAALFLRVSNPMIRRLQEYTTELGNVNEQLKIEIDKCRLTEEALRGSEEKYRSLFEHANDSIFIIDPSTHRFLDVNENAAKRLGYVRKELLQLTFDDIDAQMEAQRNDAIMRELLDTGSVTFEHVHLRKDGTKVPVEISSRLMEYGGRQVFQSIARDITERKRTEEALRESEKRYRDLYENAPNAYFSISAVDGSVLRCNSAALQLLGYDKKTITKMKVLDLYADTPHGISKAKEIIKRFQAGESIRDVELQMKRKDGQPIWISLTVDPLIDQNGNVVESRSMVINISERKRAEEALQKAHNELERRVEERTAELKQEIRERTQAEEALRESERQLRHLSSQLLTAQENERKRIARELHDGIGQSLSALKFGVENSLKQMDKRTARPIIKPLEAVIPIIQESIGEVRKIAMDLRPATLDDLGILATIAWFCREFQTIYSGIRIEKEINIQENEVPDPLNTAKQIW